MTCVSSPQSLVPFPLLADPSGYQACPTDLTHDAEKREYVLNLFVWHTQSLVQELSLEARDRGLTEQQIQSLGHQVQQHVQQYLQLTRAKPDHGGRLDILKICNARDQALRGAGIHDAYRLAKQRENHAALALLALLLAELDAMPAASRASRLVQGIFAGNIFDLGATKTLTLFQNGQRISFADSLKQLRSRPWLVDDLDVWLERLSQGQPYRHAVLFVDNAGPDVLLGMIPFARDLLQRGSKVTLTANTLPSLNDITHVELVELVEQIAGWDAVIRQAYDSGRLQLVPSGNTAPLIDLSQISPELAQAVTDDPVDLVVLEGMGRAVESNFDAKIRCDAIKVAMIKDPGTARTMGGSVYDLVFRFEPCAR